MKMPPGFVMVYGICEIVMFLLSSIGGGGEGAASAGVQSFAKGGC